MAMFKSTAAQLPDLYKKTVQFVITDLALRNDGGWVGGCGSALLCVTGWVGG